MAAVDFLQYAKSYYFDDGDDRTSLAHQISYALDIAGEASHAGHRAARQTPSRSGPAMCSW
ncbi:hypothetical protein ACIF8W_02825 [Streptomyces sp. NPDC085639]|uniref:hypothetical protein n=1 Tax=Streptomyces sp. NPDC085639 TaxID=3365734 RepID=UPI0037CE5A2F